jgi:hypothetical protein
MSTVITMKQNWVEEGIILEKDLVHLWKSPAYPPEIHASLLAVLEKFEIAFTLPTTKDGGKYIDRISNTNSLSSHGILRFHEMITSLYWIFYSRQDQLWLLYSFIYTLFYYLVLTTSYRETDFDCFLASRGATCKPETKMACSES